MSNRLRHFPRELKNLETTLRNSERDIRNITRRAVSEYKRETNTIGRKAANDPQIKGQKDRIDTIRLAALSDIAGFSKSNSESRKRVLDNRAKAKAADRRRYNPEDFPYTWRYPSLPSYGYAQPRTRFNTLADVQAEPRGRLAFTTPGLADPCTKRKERRQVLFALKRNKGSHKPKRRGPFSHIGC